MLAQSQNLASARIYAQIRGFEMAGFRIQRQRRVLRVAAGTAVDRGA